MKRLASLLFFVGLGTACVGQDMPRLQKNSATGHYSLFVDGKPFLMLGAQIGNSSAWPATMPAAWTALESFHVNTVEAPVYWEQMEPSRGTFDFSSVDMLVNQAREHHAHLVLLWFGTWKNGQNHYVPGWMKSDVKTYPREISAYGKVLDVMSPLSTENLEADKTAFRALLRHVKEIDAAQHTVVMIQVENESGSIGAVRDYSPAAQKAFEGQVPPDLTRALHTASGTWTKVFGPDADESFAAYTTAHYIDEVAKAGKAEYPLPMYCNVWFAYPVHALENRDRPSPGQEYPSGGPQQANIGIWKAAAPAIDILAPDFYSADASLLRHILATYARPDNALFIPETHFGTTFGRYLFYALGSGAIGFSPFGIDRAAQSAEMSDGKLRPVPAAENFAVLRPMQTELARLNYDGKLQTGVEEKGSERQTLHFGDIDAVLSFGFPQSDGTFPPGTAEQQGRGLVAQVGPDEFLVAGFDVSVSFRLPAANHAQQLEILRAEQGTYVDGKWTTSRILNGDETDRGLNFRSGSLPLPVRIKLLRLPLYDGSISRP